MSEWRSAPTRTETGMQEVYQEMLPTKVYHYNKTRLCSKAPETQAHVLAACCTLAQTKCLSRHNAALQILFFELLMDLELVESVPLWYSPVQPKALYENSKAKAYWDVPLYAESIEVRANRIATRSQKSNAVGNELSLDLKYRGEGR